MSLSFIKTDGGDHWTYRARFKKWQVMLICFGSLLVGYLAYPLRYEIRTLAVLFGIGFAFVYGMSSLPMTWALRRAIKKGQQIIVEKKDGYDQYSVPK